MKIGNQTIHNQKTIVVEIRTGGLPYTWEEAATIQALERFLKQENSQMTEPFIIIQRRVDAAVVTEEKTYLVDVETTDYDARMPINDGE